MAPQLQWSAQVYEPVQYIQQPPLPKERYSIEEANRLEKKEDARDSSSSDARPHPLPSLKVQAHVPRAGTSMEKSKKKQKKKMKGNLPSSIRPNLTGWSGATSRPLRLQNLTNGVWKWSVFAGFGSEIGTYKSVYPSGETDDQEEMDEAYFQQLALQVLA